MSVLEVAGTGPDSNVFLVTGEDPLIVDTGTGSHHVMILKRLLALCDGKRPKRIVLTHRHYDHVGGAARMAKELGAEVFIHELDAKVVEEGDIRGTAANFYTMKMEPVIVTRLQGGEAISTGDHLLKVIHTPGHTAGGICLYDERTRDLISGDTVFVGGVGRWDLPSGNRRELVSSINKLIGLGPKAIFPGHGESSESNASDIVRDALTYLGES
jgi:hydroxyacylglutathione hydrolase